MEYLSRVVVCRTCDTGVAANVLHGVAVCDACFDRAYGEILSPFAPVQLPLWGTDSPWYVPGVPLNPATALGGNVDVRR